MAVLKAPSKAKSLTRTILHSTGMHAARLCTPYETAQLSSKKAELIEAGEGLRRAAKDL